MPLIDLSADLGPNTEPMMAPLDDEALPPGTFLGGCQILEPLSSDGMSILYLANDSALQRHVLIREHHPARLVSRQGMQLHLRKGADDAVRAAALEAFLQEGRLMVRLDHPSIAKVYRLWEQNQTAYMMMPFYRGENLAVTLQAMEGPPSEAWLRELLSPLLGALQALHEAGCFHLALSPDNIWLTPDGRPMLLDLSASNQVRGERRRDSADSVDRLYAPIEQFSHGSEFPIGPWTDLYAVGAVVHQALLGRPPTSAAILGTEDHLAPLAEGLLARGPRYAHLGYSPAFLAVIDKTLAVKPQDRPQSAAELDAALKALAPALQQPRNPLPAGAADTASAGLDFDLSAGAPEAAAQDDTDPAAAAAIAMAIASLPWVGKQEPTLDRPTSALQDGVAAPAIAAGSRPSADGLREPVFASLPVADTAAASARPESQPRNRNRSQRTSSSSSARRSAAEAAAAASRRAQRRAGLGWVTAGVLMVGAACLGWYANESPGVGQLMARLSGSQPNAAGSAAAEPAQTPPATSVASAQTGTAVASSASAPLAPSSATAESNAATSAAPVTAKAATGPATQVADAGADNEVIEPPQAVQPARKPAASAQSQRLARSTHRSPASFDPESLPPTAAGPATPRAACGNRSNFALVYCMETQCKRPAFSRHPQCVAFRQDGEAE